MNTHLKQEYYYLECESNHLMLKYKNLLSGLQYHKQLYFYLLRGNELLELYLTILQSEQKFQRLLILSPQRVNMVLMLKLRHLQRVLQ